jgi:4-nitrophenyl phosphatase
VAYFLKSKYPPGTKVFTIGLFGLPEEVAHAGFTVVNSLDMLENSLGNSDDYLQMDVDPGVKVVIAGFSPLLNYYMIAYAARCVQNGAELIAGNVDKYDKVGKYNIPSSGCTVAAIEACTGAKAMTVGKPDPFMLRLATERDHLDSAKTIVFGDKMDTDILLAKNYKVASVLMLTGVESRESAARYSFAPDYILPSLFDVMQGRNKL